MTTHEVDVSGYAALTFGDDAGDTFAYILQTKLECTFRVALPGGEPFDATLLAVTQGMGDNGYVTWGVELRPWDADGEPDAAQDVWVPLESILELHLY